MQVGFPQKSTFGTLTATKIITEEIDTAVGSLIVKKLGTTKLIIDTNVVYPLVNLKLGSGKKLTDFSNAVIIATDNAGHIDELARIDADMLTDPEKFKQTIDLVSTNLSGGQINTGAPLCWIAVANASVKGYIGAIMPFRRFGGKSEITKVTLWYGTNNNDAYITRSMLYRLTKDGTVEATVIDDTDDLSNGTTGDTFKVWTITEDIEEGYYYWYQFDAVVPAGTVYFYGLTFEGESITP